MLSLYTDCDNNGEEAIPDYTQDVENKALSMIESKALHMALEQLDTESRQLIYALYFADRPKTEHELAQELGISQNAVNKRKKKVLQTLKFLVVKIQKSFQ